MKKIVQLFALCLVIASCDFQKVTELQDDFEIKVSAEPVFSIVNLKVFNGKDGSVISENLDLSFSGVDADKIYTVNGTKDYKIENGFVTLGINRNSTVTAENPLRATAVVSANGFITKTQEINFDGSDIQEVQISLLERENLPENIVLESVTKTLENNKTTEEIVVEAVSNTDAEQTVGVTIPEGTEFEDEDGNLVTGGEVTVDLQTFDIEEPDFESFSEETSNPEQLPSGLNEFPGDFTLEDDEPATSNKSLSKKEVLNNGTYLVPIRRQPCLYVYVNGRRVWWRGSSGRNMQIRTLIYSWTNNPNTGQRIKVGDKIAVYRRVGNRNVKLTDVNVQPYSSRYVQITFNIPGSGIYPYGFEVTPDSGCNLQPVNNITFKNDGRRTFYWYGVAHKTNPRRTLRWGYMYFNGTYQVNSRNIRYWRNRALNMLKDDMILTIYYYNRQERRVKVAYTKEVSKCELDGQTIEINNTECYEERDLNLSLACPDATYLLNNVYVYYKKENDRWFSYFDRVRNSRLDGKSPCLEDGVKYQFGFWYGGWKVTPPLTEDEMLDLYENFDLPTICNAIRDL